MSFEELKGLQQTDFAKMSPEQINRAKIDIINKLNITSQNVMYVSYDLKQKLQLMIEKFSYDSSERFGYNATESIKLIQQAEAKNQQAGQKIDTAELNADKKLSAELSKLPKSNNGANKLAGFLGLDGLTSKLKPTDKRV